MQLLKHLLKQLCILIQICNFLICGMLKNVIRHKLDRECSTFDPKMEHYIELSNVVSVWETIKDYLTIIELFQVHRHLTGYSARKVIKEWPCKYLSQLLIIIVFILKQLLKNLV